MAQFDLFTIESKSLIHKDNLLLNLFSIWDDLLVEPYRATSFMARWHDFMARFQPGIESAPLPGIMLSRRKKAPMKGLSY